MRLQDPAGSHPGGVLHPGGARCAQRGQRHGEGRLHHMAARGLGHGHGRCAALAHCQLLLLLCAPVLAPAQGEGCFQVWRRKGWAVGTGAALLWLVM